MNPDSRIYVAGHTGLVGSAIVRALKARGYDQLMTSRHSDHDLTDREAVHDLFTEQPDYVFLAAAKVGGIWANSESPASFIYENLMIAANVIEESRERGVRKLLFLGSSCIYPRDCPQPIKEEYLMTGPLEETNRAYAIAKIAGLEMCRAYRKQYGFNAISLMPTNLYGPGDNFDLETSHVLPAMIRKFHEAKVCGVPSVRLWGTGTPRREFMHVDDLADACIWAMDNYNDAMPLNVGTGLDSDLRWLAATIAGVIGYDGRIKWDSSKPDGTPRKWLDTSRINALGWKARIDLTDGIRATYEWFLEHEAVVA